jgi:hypothetical protein
LGLTNRLTQAFASKNSMHVSERNSTKQKKIHKQALIKNRDHDQYFVEQSRKWICLPFSTPRSRRLQFFPLSFQQHGPRSSLDTLPRIGICLVGPKFTERALAAAAAYAIAEASFESFFNLSVSLFWAYFTLETSGDR